MRPRAGWDEFCSWSTDEARKEGITVHEAKCEPQETGLYDHLGNPLQRLPEPMRPIGFLHAYDKEP